MFVPPVFLQGPWSGFQPEKHPDQTSWCVSKIAFSHYQDLIWFASQARCAVCVICVCVLDKPVLSVSVALVPCTQVSMELFDPIYSCGVLRPSGRVVKCLHDVNPDYDELRQVTLSSFDPSICFDADSIQDFVASSRCYRMKIRSTTMQSGKRDEKSFCSASSNTCALEESSVSTRTPLIPTSAPQRKYTKTWLGQHFAGVHDDFKQKYVNIYSRCTHES